MYVYDTLQWSPVQGVSPPRSHCDPDQEKHNDDDAGDEDDGLILTQAVISRRQHIDL